MLPLDHRDLALGVGYETLRAHGAYFYVSAESAMLASRPCPLISISHETISMYCTY